MGARGEKRCPVWRGVLIQGASVLREGLHCRCTYFAMLYGVYLYTAVHLSIHTVRWALFSSGSDSPSFWSLVTRLAPSISSSSIQDMETIHTDIGRVSCSSSHNTHTYNNNNNNNQIHTEQDLCILFSVCCMCVCMCLCACV